MGIAWKMRWWTTSRQRVQLHAMFRHWTHKLLRQSLPLAIPLVSISLESESPAKWQL